MSHPERWPANIPDPEVVCEHLRVAGFRIVARVIEPPDALDIAFMVTNTVMGVIRCVNRPRASDHTALMAMLLANDFSWALIVASSGSEPPGLAIEVLGLDDLPKYLADLARARQSSP